MLGFELTNVMNPLSHNSPLLTKLPSDTFYQVTLRKSERRFSQRLKATVLDYIHDAGTTEFEIFVKRHGGQFRSD